MLRLRVEGMVLLVLILPAGLLGWWVAGWNTATWSVSSLGGRVHDESTHCWVLRRQSLLCCGGGCCSLVAALADRLTRRVPFRGAGVVVVVWSGCVVVC